MTDFLRKYIYINMWLGECIFLWNGHPNQWADLGETWLTGGNRPGKKHRLGFFGPRSNYIGVLNVTPCACG